MSEFFPKLYKTFGGNVKAGLDLSNYATKADLKGATDVETSNLAVKSDLANLKAEVDKRDIGTVITVPADVSC